MYLVEVNANPALPILAEIYIIRQNFCSSLRTSIFEFELILRLCGICWLCLMAILDQVVAVVVEVVVVNSQVRKKQPGISPKLEVCALA